MDQQNETVIQTTQARAKARMDYGPAEWDCDPDYAGWDKSQNGQWIFPASPIWGEGGGGGGELGQGNKKRHRASLMSSRQDNHE